jgi:hypothetical protein
MTTNKHIVLMGESRRRILEIRHAYLSTNADAFKGNRRERKDYLAQLAQIKPGFTKFQAEYLVGLNLSDSTVDMDHGKKQARLKIQQKVKRVEWVKHFKEIFLEYIANDREPAAPSESRQHMVELVTFKCNMFYNFFYPLFYANSDRKSVTTQVVDLITPVSVAAWLCGDGSRADHTKNKGKGITFHSQGFTLSENVLLASALQDNLGIAAKAKLDNPDKDQWRIDVSGKSYETFCEKVGPWIHPDFHVRVPVGRVEGSGFGYMTEEKRLSLLGSSLGNLQNTIDYY